MKNTYSRMQLKPSKICIFITVQLLFQCGLTSSVYARDYFNPALLERLSTESGEIDLSAFEESEGQLPGTYLVDIFINNEKKETKNIKFDTITDEYGKSILQPCLSLEDLIAWGVFVKKYPDLIDDHTGCVNLKAIPQASSELRFSKQQLLLSIPQAAMKNSARGWVDPKEWDDGIFAAILNYSASGAQTKSKNKNSNDSDNQFLNLRPGLNFGPWRLRNYTTWSRTSSDGNENSNSGKWNNVYSYLQRDIKALKSQLVIGDSISPSDIFTSVPFRGVQISSDDEMLPESIRGYAPSVKGIAKTDAQVTVRQNGYVIYQTYVSPGSFEINDMYPTGGSGDLYVTIKESDGSEQEIVIPYASLPVLQREGRLKYSLTTANYRSYDKSRDKTNFTQGTFIYGLPAEFTVYGGTQFSKNYQSYALGMGKNIGEFGAVSTDVTQAWAKRKDQNKDSGRSFRVRYSKNILSTGTNFSIAGYRYATSGYWDLQEVLDSYGSGESINQQERRRNRAEISMTQRLGDKIGSFGLSAIREDYWNSNNRLESYGLRYNNSWNGISYEFGYSYNINSKPASKNQTNFKNNEQLFSFNMSVPLNNFFGSNNRNSMYASYSMNSSNNGNTNNNVGLSGTLLEENNLNWNIQQGYGTKGQSSSGSFNANWRPSYGELNGGYSYDKYNNRINYGLKGGIIAHSEGITLSQPLGETITLVSAPGAKNVAISGKTGIKTDYRGYAVIPYVSPYRKNDISLNTETMNEETEVAITTQTVTPSRGAVVKAKFKTNVGKRVLMTILRPNGSAVPFGSTVSKNIGKDEQAFIVGDEGQVYLSGLDNTGVLTTRWGAESHQQCTVNYNLTAKEVATGIITLKEYCK